ncbi:MAG: rhodanese-like domain-containing protein [Thermoplasmatales archaeon]|nr:MAG: rhodanese-like domain-containing protein [Thermoplasmatales archaeon]
MRYNLNRKWLAFGTTVLLMGLIFGSTGNAVIIENKQRYNMATNNGISSNLNNDYTNITVYEAWDMLNDTSNGIQIPVDVRTDGEWNSEHIDTPPPEDPIHYCLDLLQNETGLQEFMTLFEGEEVVLYCKSGYRSFVATNILVDNNFTGTIYNMLGGILAWKAAGFPTKNESEPDLYCDGSLSWTNIKPGAGINGSFIVENVGDHESKLNWDVESYPDWGYWAFIPSSGYNLTIEDGQILVNVSVFAPNEKNVNFTGTVKLINSDNPSDNCTIDVFLSISKNRAFNIFTPFLRFLENHPRMFPILRYMLGL